MGWTPRRDGGGAGALHLAHGDPGASTSCTRPTRRSAGKDPGRARRTFNAPAAPRDAALQAASEGAAGARGDAGRAPGSAPRGTARGGGRRLVVASAATMTPAPAQEGAGCAASMQSRHRHPGRRHTDPAPGGQVAARTFRSSLRRAPSTIRGKGRTRGAHRLTIGAGGTKELAYHESSIAYSDGGSIHAQPDREVTTFVGEVPPRSRRGLYQIPVRAPLTPRFDEGFRRNGSLIEAASTGARKDLIQVPT